MMRLNFIRKKKYDERQKADLHRVGYYGFWLAYYLLFADISVRGVLLGIPLTNWASEFLIFIIMSIYMCIGCIRFGVWTPSCSRPTLKHYAFYSLAGGLAGASLDTVFLIIRRENTEGLKLVLTFLSIFVSIFLLTFAAFLVVGGLYNRKRIKTEKELDKETEYEEEI